jgi:hypothetical protein
MTNKYLENVWENVLKKRGCREMGWIRNFIPFYQAARASMPQQSLGKHGTGDQRPRLEFCLCQ